MKIKSTNKNRGFTIIEVMIVLAIAGLILAIIFLAVPALQRNSRNTQRDSDATHLGGLIETSIANNAGKTPLTINTAATPAAPVNTVVYVGGESFARWTPVNSNIIAPPTPIPVPALDTLVVYSSASCNNGTPAGGGSTLIVVYAIEAAGNNGLLHCVAA